MAFLALYDTEAAYTVQLARFLGAQRSFPFEVRAFTEKEKLRQFLTMHTADLLLIAESDYTEDMVSLPASLTVILREGTGNPACSGLPGVTKYQSGPELVREILRNGPSGTPSLFASGSPGGPPLISIFSPVGRCGKSLLALALGLLLARSRPTLLISFDRYCGFPFLAAPQDAPTLSDLLCYIREEEETSLRRILAAERDWHGLTFLPPVRVARDIPDADGDEIRSLLSAVRRSGQFETVLADFGSDVPDALSLLSDSKQIYMPVPDDPVSACKTDCFEHQLRLAGREDLLARITKLRLPPPDGELPSSARFADRLPLSPIGALSLQLIRRDGL